jgi:hypothetical protein
MKILVSYGFFLGDLDETLAAPRNSRFSKFNREGAIFAEFIKKPNRGR